MPLTTLYVLMALQWAIVGGLVCFFSAWHFSAPEWRQLPMVQRRLRKYSARRLRFSDIYLRVGFVVFGLGMLIALAVASILFIQAITMPNPRQATPADIQDTAYWQFVAAALQILLLAAFFFQLWRVRRAQRAMALEELAASGTATSAAGGADAPAGS
jgi:hypothetical protein